MTTTTANSDRVSNRSLVRRAPLLLQETFEERFAGLVGFFRGRKHDDSTAQDIAAEAMLRLAEYESDGEVRQPKNLLYRIALNTETDHFRRESRQRSIEVHQSWLAADHDSALRPEEAEVIAEETISKLKSLMEKLPRRQRDVVLLSTISGYSNRNIAEKLQISEAAVRQHYSRALKAVRRAYYASLKSLDEDAASHPTPKTKINGLNGHTS